MARRRRMAFSPSPLPLAVLLLLLLLFAGRFAYSRLISPTIAEEALDLAVSDGISSRAAAAVKYSPFLRLPEASAAAECEPSYGFLPCTTTVLGNLFLVIVYGFLMLKAATYLSSGSELLLGILGPGIIGGLFLPILGALPDALLILVSGLSGSKETAQDQVLIGMGLLAGSTVMLLTVLWGSCVIVGKCDISEYSTSIDLQDTKGFSLFGSGITVDAPTCYSARIMALSIIPFIIVQLPKVFKFPSGQRVAVLVALIMAIVLLLSYCLYQIVQPWIQKRRLEYAKYRLVISGILRLPHIQALGQLIDDRGNPNLRVIEKLFHQLDLNGDNRVSRSELRALIIGLQIDEINLDKDDAVDAVMKEFDTSGDDYIQVEEFTNGISKWIKQSTRPFAFGSSYSKKLHHAHMEAQNEHAVLTDQGDEVEEESTENPTWTTFKAVLLLILGTIIAAVFADPLVDAVDNFSDATSIPSFFISFIAMPLATNSSEAVSAIIFASRKKQKLASLTFSEIYGAVTMNNTLCLAIFLALVYFRHLTWDFTAEVLIILLVCVVMGVFASLRTTFPLWTCFIAFALYPLSLAIVYVLDYIFGWS
ncbi:sodium/calcium exchanger NCL2-like [Zingiber officinale]|uniref:EF-hand domain-containing protein n=1 Tax=Zingiber officinale TaxID=94328 RepID=A0A8J5F263_ZINOF|nr:sodium/calcium exchanger NCL2-like [Zingiber officinale]KAG6480170.1 hypothetical protein ZIOFF_063648 [Zingiber officinale]